MLIELKVGPTIEPLHKAQAISYLKIPDADLALVVSYGGPSLQDERLPNSVRDLGSPLLSVNQVEPGSDRSGAINKEEAR